MSRSEEDTKYWRLPQHMQEGMRAYVERGQVPGSFLRAVLENNLYQAFVQADDINRRCMVDYAAFLESGLPAAAWGSAKEVDAWIELGGLEGLRKKEGASNVSP